jgi:NAD(P)-dependent dehydrogenase (short-subunit alcohol dehydrogenase family)
MAKSAYIHWLGSEVSCALARGLVARGFQVTGVAEPRVAEGLNLSGVRVEAVDKSDYVAWLEQHSELLGVDLLVVVPELAPSLDWLVEKTIASDLEDSMQLTFELLRAATRPLMRRRKGDVIVIPPQLTEEPVAEEAALGERKAAVLTEGLYALTKVFALELASRGIRAQLLDITSPKHVAGALDLIGWLAEGGSGFTTGQRFAIGRQLGGLA